MTDKRCPTCDGYSCSCAKEAELQPPMEEVATLGNIIIFRQDNGAGGHCYWSDAIGGGVLIYDTNLCSREEIEAVMRLEYGGEPDLHAQIATLTAQLAEARGLLERYVVIRNYGDDDAWAHEALHSDVIAFLAAAKPTPHLDMVPVRWKERPWQQHALCVRRVVIGVCYVGNDGNWHAHHDHAVYLGPFTDLPAAKAALLKALRGE